MIDDEGRHGPVDEDEDEAYSVRPYTMTGGRTRSANAAEVPLETLVEGLTRPAVTHTREHRQILELTATQYLSVIELAAHIKIPVGVARILVSDLQAAEAVRLHGPTPSTPGSSQDKAATLGVLESVLNGIASL